MFHNSQAVLALSKEENPTVFQKTLGVNDYYFATTLRVPDGQHPDGRQVAGADVPRREADRDQAGADRSLEEVARHAVDFWLSTEDLPRPDNRVTVDGEGRVTLVYTPTNDEPKQRLFHQLKSMLAHMGMHQDHLLPRHAYLKNEIPVAGCAHQAGTCRFGGRPSVRPERRLPSPRGRQPLHRRYELLPEHRRRESGADGDGQRPASRRPPPRATRRESDLA